MDYLSSVINVIHGSSISAGLLLFTLTLIDGLVIIGLLINGWGAFVVCVYSYANGYISMQEMIIFGFLGVFVGEQISFYLGYVFGPRIVQVMLRLASKIERLKRGRVLKVLPVWVSEESLRRSIDQLSLNINRWGGIAVITGRWTPIASVVPTVCSTLSMPYLRFIRLSAVSCLFWVLGWMIIVHLTVIGYLTIFNRYLVQ